MPPLPRLDDELAALERAGRLRACPPLEEESAPSRIRARYGGRAVTTFCSNDYLGLAAHPALSRAAAEAATLHGTGAAASRLVSGETASHRALEHALAELVELPSAL